MSMKINDKATAERVREVFQYDPETGIFRWLINRYPRKAGDIAGALTFGGYWRIAIDRTSYPAGRVAWLHFYGVWPNGLVDHKDGNKLNNAIKNLREASSVENGRNSIAKGYCSDSHGKYIAYIYVNRKQISLGRYETEEQAAHARLAGTQKYFGEFSLENSRGDSL
jgi:hypothetical protein